MGGWESVQVDDGRAGKRKGRVYEVDMDMKKLALRMRMRSVSVSDAFVAKAIMGTFAD